MIRTRSFPDPATAGYGEPIERTVVELDEFDEFNTRWCDVFDLRRWNVYDVVFRALPQTEDYRLVFGGISYSARVERELMPTSFDEAYARAEEWILHGTLPPKLDSSHLRRARNRDYDAVLAYVMDQQHDDLMTPTGKRSILKKR